MIIPFDLEKSVHDLSPANNRLEAQRYTELLRSSRNTGSKDVLKHSNAPGS